MSQSWFCHTAAHVSVINGHLLQFYFYIMLRLTVDTVFCVCIIPSLCKHGPVDNNGSNPVIVNVYTYGSIDTNGCHTASLLVLGMNHLHLTFASRSSEGSVETVGM